MRRAIFHTSYPTLALYCRCRVPDRAVTSAGLLPPPNAQRENSQQEWKHSGGLTRQLLIGCLTDSFHGDKINNGDVKKAAHRRRSEVILGLN